MKKYIIKNCPAVIDTTFKNRMCYENYGEDCQNNEVDKFDKENQLKLF